LTKKKAKKKVHCAPKIVAVCLFKRIFALYGMVEDDSFFFVNFLLRSKPKKKKVKKNESDVIEQWPPPLDAPGDDGLEKVGYWKKLNSYSCRGASKKERKRERE
jgi:hypothetical protein